MSLKETLGLRSHREDPKMFWFQLTLLCLLAGLACALARLLGAGVVWWAAGRTLLSWALVCALLTHAQGQRKRRDLPLAQTKLENRLLLLSCLLAVLDGLVCLFPDGGAPYPAGLAGAALYYIACLAGPRLWRKSPFTSREIFLILACGVLACVLLIPFLDKVWAIVSGPSAPQ